ncbi:hypothetical protein ACNTMW_01450 [Planosporangium sp. 12N6]|uniref:hypothetical protein n=1 Tax=Planosporangium spinosum TaxID=3402278 RepID=UPI003CF010B9
MIGYFEETENMERVPASRAADLLADRARDRRQALHECDIPIVALSEAAKPAAERFGGFERFNDAITAIRIVYGARRDDVWVTVETARWVGTRVSSASLRTLVEDHMRQYGDRFSSVAWTEGDATVIVDGQPVAGRIVRAGSRWWAVRCERGDIEISIAAHDWHPDSIEVETLTDLEPLLSDLERRPVPRPPAAPREPEPLPDELSREPHRALVDTVLRQACQHTEWMADGGPPPQLPSYWSSLWQAAIQRQMTLADQSESQAKRAVQRMLSHLSALHHSVAWFRDDDRLRERAVAETLLYATGLSDDVSSRRAQQAWQRRRQAGDPPPADYAEVEAEGRAQQHWLDEWAAWARDHTEAPR